MATITINVQIELTPDDWAAMGAKAAALLGGLWSQPGATIGAMVAEPVAMKVAQDKAVGQPTGKRVAQRAKAVAAAAPKLSMVTPVPVLNGHVEEMPEKKIEETPTRKVMPWKEYDALVRKEVKRLSMDGRLPGRRLWNSQRDPQLPTLDAVCARYTCSSPDSLAKMLGYEPPLKNHRSPAGAVVLDEMDGDV